MVKKFLQIFFGLLLIIVFVSNDPCWSKEKKEEVHNKFELLANLRNSKIYSPKSVIFSTDGKKFYVNALEGKSTLVFDSETLEMIKVIPHNFTIETANLFLNNENTLFDYEYNNCYSTGEQNIFSGKPVESTLTQDGKYLWVTYYRRNCDPNSSSPSAIAIIDTETDEIVRVMPTGPIPKTVTNSGDNKFVAITHWGDNTLGILDISSNDPATFTYKAHLTVGKRLAIKNISKNRDRRCGLCLRATAFTKDGLYLFVAGMASNRLTVFETQNWEEIGSVRLPVANPRHMVLSHDGERLYVSFNIPGKIAAISVQEILDNAPEHKPCSGEILRVGQGVRTIAISNDDQRLYVVCNRTSTLSCIDLKSWKIIDTIAVHPYAVGLAINPEETLAVVTSQGRNRHGGNNVAVYSIKP